MSEALDTASAVTSPMTSSTTSGQHASERVEVKDHPLVPQEKSPVKRQDKTGISQFMI